VRKAVCCSLANIEKGIEVMKILLACSAGMSTSFVVQRMKKASADAGNTDKIWAIPVGDLEYEDDYDVVLLGPQVAKNLDEAKEQLNKDVPIGIIPKDMYGKCDGEGVLKLAYELAGGERK